MTTKKKLALIITIVISFLVLLFVGYLLYFYYSTDSYDDIIKSLNSRSLNKSADFQSIDQAVCSKGGKYEYNNYIFFVNNTKSEKQVQEMAIYKKKYFLFTDWCRYVVDCDGIGSLTGTDDPIGVLTTTLEQDNGNESRVCIFYSDNNSDKQITRTEYTLYNADTLLDTYTNEKAGGDIYLFMVDHLGEETIGEYISLPNAKFYNAESELVYEYIH